jgi:hypothetical protein
MIANLFESGIILYTFFQVFIALTAVVLSVKWNKYEFLAGLIFLLIYAIVNIIDVVYFTVIHGVFLDIAQFGFILLALVFFIIGMHPLYAPKLASGLGKRNTGYKPREASLISQLRKG